MKNLFSNLFILILCFGAFAQAPQKMSYQAVIRNSTNNLVANTTVNIRISVLQGSINGTAIYVETQTPTTNANGLVTLEIGSGKIVTGTFDGINWANGPYFIKTETATSSTGNYSIIGTSQLMSVPYALYAKTAGSVSGSSNGFTHYIGELYQGGIVVSVWKKDGVEHGLIASLTDLSTSQVWSSVGALLIGTTAQSSRNGQANTTAVISQTGHTSSAASLCDNYTSGGYSDWYLPAIWELNQCYDAALSVNEVLGDTNGFQYTSLYWSSTENTNNGSWCQRIGNGAVAYSNKATAQSVRAVRRF
jgi:hypothetical protein